MPGALERPRVRGPLSVLAADDPDQLSVQDADRIMYSPEVFRNQLSFTFSIKLPHSGAGIALWNLPKEYNYKANALKNGEKIIERYENVQYVKDTQKLKNLEQPWKYDELFNAEGDLGKFIPHVIPHLEGHAFWYHGMVMHQMILGQNFKKGDYRITFQGHALKCDGKWRLWW